MLHRLTKVLKREEAGFTLIELMIVILVIMILAAILVPQFGLAQERARKAKCISNQRNLETSVAMWATDNPNTSYKAGTFATTAVPSYANLTGAPQYTVTAAFTEPDDPNGATSVGADYFLYDGSGIGANQGNGTVDPASPEYGHVACAFDGYTDPWVDNADTAGNNLAIDHRRDKNYQP